jgi:hypothetical protein
VRDGRLVAVDEKAGLVGDAEPREVQGKFCHSM